MAIEITSIPQLRDSAAKRFEKNAKKAASKKASVDFKTQQESVSSILAKANLM